MKPICLFVFVLLIGIALAVPDDKPTSLSDAQAAIDANLRTTEGKAYDEQMGNDLMQKYLDNLRQCKRTAGGSQESFWILIKLDKDGSAKEVLLHPVTKVGNCDREALSKAKLGRRRAAITGSALPKHGRFKKSAILTHFSLRRHSERAFI